MRAHTHEGAGYKASASTPQRKAKGLLWKTSWLKLQTVLFVLRLLPLQPKLTKFFLHYPWRCARDALVVTGTVPVLPRSRPLFTQYKTSEQFSLKGRNLRDKRLGAVRIPPSLCMSTRYQLYRSSSDSCLGSLGCLGLERGCGNDCPTKLAPCHCHLVAKWLCLFFVTAGHREVPTARPSVASQGSLFTKLVFRTLWI